MYIEVNGQQYQNAQRMVTCAFVDFYAEGLENVDKAYGIVNSYEDDGALLATDNTADYSAQERVGNRLRLYKSSKLTSREKREQAYETRACVEYDGQTLTVDAANKLYLAYSAEGQMERAQELSTLIAVAKADIRAEWPD